MRGSFTVVFVVLAVALTACSRGCLRRTLPEPGDGGGAADPLAVVDCPSGVLRCRTGVVERHGSATACATCACPWVATGTVCEDGCLVDELELVRDESEARSLCADRAPSSFAPDPLPDASPASVTCEEGIRFVCAGNVVHACALGGPVPVAQCLNGCVVEGESEDDEELDVARARSLMCRRSRRPP